MIPGQYTIKYILFVLNYKGKEVELPSKANIVFYFLNKLKNFFLSQHLMTHLLFSQRMSEASIFDTWQAGRQCDQISFS
jgi:hypothetical protein